jgi:hypothetical protein
MFLEAGSRRQVLAAGWKRTEDAAAILAAGDFPHF